MIDIKAGTFQLTAGFAVNDKTTVEEVTSVARQLGIKDLGEKNGFRVFSIPLVKLWNRNFTVTLRFEDEKLHFIDLIWIDGPVNKLGYSASENDLLTEKRQLVKMLINAFGQEPKDTSLGVDYFPFSWGLVSVRADLRSTYCSIVIDYFWQQE